MLVKYLKTMKSMQEKIESFKDKISNTLTLKSEQKDDKKQSLGSVKESTLKI